jgi:hypothetical protein
VWAASRRPGQAEIPAVVASSIPSDICAIAFSRQFYRSLVGMDIERAVSAGASPPTTRTKRAGLVSRSLPARTRTGGFSGAADGQVRQTARSAAEVDVGVRVKNVAKGGLVCGRM